MMISDSNLILLMYKRIKQYIDDHAFTSNTLHVDLKTGHLLQEGDSKQIFKIDERGHLIIE